MSAPLYGDNPNADIIGEPFPPHPYKPVGADGSACGYVWKEGRPCTLGPSSTLHAAYVADNFSHRLEAGVRTKLATSETGAILELLFREARDLAVAKDQAYGGAWLRQGYMGNTARVLSKVERLRELVWSDRVMSMGDTVGGETVEDTLLDLMNLAAMTLHNVRTGNRWGTR